MKSRVNLAASELMRQATVVCRRLAQSGYQTLLPQGREREDQSMEIHHLRQLLPLCSWHSRVQIQPCSNCMDVPTPLSHSLSGASVPAAPALGRYVVFEPLWTPAEDTVWTRARVLRDLRCCMLMGRV